MRIVTDFNGLTYYEVDFNSDGTLDTAGGGGDGGLPAAVAAGGINDLFVFSHGWNSGVDSARDLYQAMFGLLANQLGGHLSSSAAVGIIWPSLLFPDDDPDTAPPVPSTGGELAAALTPAFPGQQQQLATMGQLLDQQPQDPAKLTQFHQLAGGLVTTPAQGVEDTGEAALLTADTATAFGHAAAMAPHAPSGAQGIGNPFTGLWSGAREVLRTLSYYEMKNRAGVIGQSGLGPLLAGLAGPVGPPRIHLMGHSFGARLVSYCPGGSARRSDRRGQPGQIAHADPGRVFPLHVRLVPDVRPVPGGWAGGRRQPGRRALAGHVQQRRPGVRVVVSDGEHARRSGQRIRHRPGVSVGRDGPRRVPADPDACHGAAATAGKAVQLRVRQLLRPGCQRGHLRQPVPHQWGAQ